MCFDMEVDVFDFLSLFSYFNFVVDAVVMDVFYAVVDSVEMILDVIQDLVYDAVEYSGSLFNAPLSWN